MIPELRPYQKKLIQDVYAEWDAGKQYVVMVSATGSGKSMTLTELVRMERDRGQYVLVLAHRQELITQLSETMARMEIHHAIIAAQGAIKFATRLHMENYNRNFYDPNSPVIVASVHPSAGKVDNSAKAG